GVKSTKNINFLVLLTPFDLLPPPNPTLFGIFTFLMLSPTNRSQNSENPIENKQFRAYLVKLSKTSKLQKFFDYKYISYLKCKVNKFHMYNHLSKLVILVVLCNY
ncbi:unnamed protein product, partial [Meganyctiphanes norvegica]